MEFRSAALWVCILAFVGSSATIVNSIYPNNQSVVLGTIVLAGSFVLFLAFIAEMMTFSIVSAVQGKKLEEQTGLLATVIGRSVFKVIDEEMEKKKQS
jgi:hypothetical protein